MILINNCNNVSELTPSSGYIHAHATIYTLNILNMLIKHVNK